MTFQICQLVRYKMKQTFLPSVFIGILACWSALSVIAEDRYQYLTWEITNGTIYPLDVPQPVGLFFTTLLKCHFFTIGMGMNMIFYFLSYQGILINGQFTGPTIEAISNDNILVNVINKLDEKFLITWLVVLFNLLCRLRYSWIHG